MLPRRKKGTCNPPQRNKVVPFPLSHSPSTPQEQLNMICGWLSPELHVESGERSNPPILREQLKSLNILKFGSKRKTLSIIHTLLTDNHLHSYSFKPSQKWLPNRRYCNCCSPAPLSIVIRWMLKVTYISLYRSSCTDYYAVAKTLGPFVDCTSNQVLEMWISPARISY